jgi:hypothetical protein
MIPRLGASCLLAAALFAAKPPASKFVNSNGARLEYLDWGGHGAPLIFLAGLGGTAHVFIDLAPEFVARPPGTISITWSRISFNSRTA